MSTLRFLQLLHLADSALPVGAAAHSFGLEAMVAENGLEAAGLFSFFRGYLQEAGRLDAVFVHAGYHVSSARQWQELNEQLSAMKPARETREASLRLGKRLAALAIEAFSIRCRYGNGPAHAAVVFGHLGHCLACPHDEVSAAYLHQSLSGLVSACQRLMPLGQSEAARLLWQLKPCVLETLAAARETDVDHVSLSQPMLDLASMRHPGLHTRLFIS
ncbi:MAG: urease accessory UreF family protein [Acidobacteriaceae bacterium]